MQKMITHRISRTFLFNHGVELEGGNLDDGAEVSEILSVEGKTAKLRLRVSIPSDSYLAADVDRQGWVKIVEEWRKLNPVPAE